MKIIIPFIVIGLIAGLLQLLGLQPQPKTPITNKSRPETPITNPNTPITNKKDVHVSHTWVK